MLKEIKQIVLLKLCLIIIGTLSAFGQSVTYKEVFESNKVPKGKYLEYITKNGLSVKLGDTVYIGTPTSTGDLPYNTLRFAKDNRHYTVMDGVPRETSEGKPYRVDQIKVAGNRKEPLIMLRTKKEDGDGVRSLVTEYLEEAMSTGELRLTRYSKSQLISKIKELDDLLEVGAINEEEHAAKKEILLTELKKLMAKV